MSGMHTSGPWQSHDDYTTDGFVTIIGNVDGEYVDGKPEYTYDVICVCEDEYGDRLQNVAANVRLIAAAPDLLAACSDWMEWLDGDVSHPFAADHEDKMLAAMRAAIARASA